MSNRIWAPWRAQYVRGEAGIPRSVSGCFLCDALASSEDRENFLVWRREKSIVMLNRFPYNTGHLLVAPRIHRGTLAELQGDDLFEPIATLKRMTEVLDRLMEPHGYNVGLNQGSAAGAGLPGHLHWHIVPRWDGDTNFMPVLTDSKVITESLFSYYDRLLEILDEFETV